MRDAAQLNLEENAIISDLRESANSCRLMELGFVPGMEIKLSRKSVNGDTYFFCLGEKHFALRKKEAEKILVES